MHAQDAERRADAAVREAAALRDREEGTRAELVQARAESRLGIFISSYLISSYLIFSSLILSTNQPTNHQPQSRRSRDGGALCSGEGGGEEEVRGCREEEEGGERRQGGGNEEARSEASGTTSGRGESRFVDILFSSTFFFTQLSIYLSFFLSVCLPRRTHIDAKCDISHTTPNHTHTNTHIHTHKHTQPPPQPPPPPRAIVQLRLLKQRN